MASWQIRDAVAEDIPDILRMIKSLAVFEREPESRVKVTEEEMLRNGFGEKPWFGSLIAEEIHHAEGNNCLPKKTVAGFLAFFYGYSTWDGRTLVVDDLYVDPAFRGKGVATKLMRRACVIAVEKGCSRLEGNVLNWNKTAKDFYGRIGAVCLDDFRLYRITGECLLELAGKKPKNDDGDDAQTLLLKAKL